jgi:hypothetical protein
MILKNYLKNYFRVPVPDGVLQIDTPDFTREKSKLLLQHHKDLPFVIRNSSIQGCYSVDYLNSKGELSATLFNKVPVGKIKDGHAMPYWLMTSDGSVTSRTMIGLLSDIRAQHIANKAVLVDQTKTLDKQKGTDEAPHHSPHG